MMYNNLLSRQLKRTVKDEMKITPEWSEFLKIVNRSYEHYERDHVLSQHSLHISSQELAEKESRIRSILEAVYDGLLVLKNDGKIETCNRRTEEIFCKKANEINSKNIEDFIKLAENGEVKTLTFQDLRTEIENEKEFVAICSDCNPVPLEIKFSQSYIGGETLYIALIRDVTQKKIKEEQLQNLHNELMIASRLVGMGEMANSMLHNIGNILNSIFVSLQVIKDKIDDGPIENLMRISELIKSKPPTVEEFSKSDSVYNILPEYLDSLINYMKDGNAIITQETQLLTKRVKHIKEIILTQQALNKTSELIEEVDVNQVIEEALKICITNKLDINIERDLLNLPLVQTDKVKIVQILVNVIKNALESLKACNKTPKNLKIKTTLKEGDILIEITDNGLGLSKENLPKIFTTGFTTKAKGNGIGLHSSAIFLQHLGGKITAFSKGINEGATFTIFLPINTAKGKDK